MKEYFKKYRSHILLLGLFVFLIHGAKLNSDIVGIDTEDLIHLQNGFYGGWLNSGRQGLIFLKYLFGNSGFNPYFTAVMTLLLFAAAVGAFCLLWDKAAGSSDGDKGLLWKWGLAGILWISHPIMTEQFYFSLQSMEICIGVLLTALALYLTGCFADRHRVMPFVGSVLLLVVTFSCYQIFVVLYIFGTVTLLLLQGIRSLAEEKEIKAGTLLKGIVPYVTVFGVAFLINMLITKLFFSSSDYLQNQIFWKTSSVKDCLHLIAAHVIKVFTGYDSVFYNIGFGVLALSALALLILFLRRCCRGKKAVFAVILFFYAALLCTPFLMTLVLGCAPTMRSQLVLPAATGFLGYLCVRLVGALQKEFSRKVVMACVAVICIVCGLEQTKVTEGLYYTDRCRYEQDAALGYSLIQKIEEVNWNKENLPIVIVGHREFSPNNACIMGEVIGRSFFDYDLEVEPVSFWSTRRMIGFLHTLGAEFYQPPREWLDAALEYSTYMPNWPSEGSVQIKDGMIIVKLSHYE